MPNQSKRVVACDLDGTLASYNGWKGARHIGAPIPAMVKKVKAALAQGAEVYIFTARVNPGGDWQRAMDATTAYLAIAEWVELHVGKLLPIVYTKSPDMIEFWDDRAKTVIANTGEFMEDHLPELAAAIK
jgi:hypothetical protein